MEASAHCASRALLPVLILMNPRTSMCGRRPDSAAIATLWCSGARCVSSASHNPGHIIIINRWRIEEASYSGMYSGFSIRHKFSALRYSRKCAWTVPQLPRVAKNFSRASFQNSFKPLFHNCFHTTRTSPSTCRPSRHMAGSIASSPPAPFDTRVRLCMTDVPCICIVTSSPPVTYFS